MVVLGLIFLICHCLLAVSRHFKLAGVEEEIFEDANFFQRMIFIGLVLQFGFIMFQSLLRGIGEVKIPLFINTAVSLGLNCILDPLFIYGWGPIPAYGVTGAAISTLFTLALSAGIGHYIFLFGKKRSSNLL